MTAVEAPHEATVIDLPVNEPGDVAGMEIPGVMVVRILQAVGCTMTDDTAEVLAVTPPSWRPDLTDPIDLVEEVIRLIGYDELPSTIPAAPLGRGMTREQRIRRRVGMVLASRGLVEVLSYPFVGDAELDALRIPADDSRRLTPTLANPMSDEQPHLRGSLLPGLVAAARRNIGRGTSDLALFELGSVFMGQVADETELRPTVDRRPSDQEWSDLNALLPHQPTQVAAFLAGNRAPQGWWGAPDPITWADAVAVAHDVADACGANLEVRRGDDPSFHPGRCAALVVDGTLIGFAGELHPRVIEATGIPERSVAMWMDLDAVITAAPDVRPAPQVGTQPLAKEDIALVVASDISAAEVEQAVREGAGDLLESVRLFDVYEGPQVPEGKKSLAFALRFRAPDRTLSTEEIAAAREGALESALQRVGATLR